MKVPYDNEEGIGWKLFRLPDSHPFYRAAVQHDRAYDDIIAGTSTKTLLQYDREFLRNMLRIAKAEGWKRQDPGEAAMFNRQAWIFYKIVRMWAKSVRPELDAYKPAE